MIYQFWIPFAILIFAVGFCEKKYCLLRDLSKAKPQPYSWSRVQLAWWTVIILSSFIAVIWRRDEHNAPDLNQSVVILLGISIVTLGTARMIDMSDQANPDIVRSQDQGRENFFLDILSDKNGASISRFQTIVFNFVFGVWFIYKFLNNIDTSSDVNNIMPVISQNNLILIGLSSAAYAAIKTTENKPTAADVQSEAKLAEDGSVG